MPKIVDHAQRREEIAQVACQVVARYGFEQSTVARIARAAGYTTGMVAHYYEAKQDIILAALRLNLRRIEERLNSKEGTGADLLIVLAEALPLDPQRATECAFWMAFWGQVPADKRLRKLNVWVHREYMRLFNRCFAEYWTEWSVWPQPLRDKVLRSVVTFINGVTVGAMTSSRDWSAAVQLDSLRRQLELSRKWAKAEYKNPRHPPGS